MKNVKLFFALIEFMVVIQSSYFISIPIRTYTFGRHLSRLSAPILRQCEVPVLRNGSVGLRQRGKLIRYNCLPSFILIGDKYSSCIQGHWENPVPMCIKPGCSKITAPDNGFTVGDKNGAMTMLFCKPGYSIAGSQETYCDGTNWDRSLGSCRQTQTSPEMYCDFEVSSICDWVSDPTHDFEWKRKNGYTSAKQLQTGPPHDHTVGVPLEGHFMLATFANQLPNSAARLISPLYPANASQNAYFRLYYHMYGATTGALRVYIKAESVTIGDILDSPKYLFMEKYGTFQNAWIESVFNIDQYDEGFQIVIEATAARTTRSNIAIDDVALLSDADCIDEETKSTAVTPEKGGIFDAQSCVNRCQETAPYSPNATEEIKINTNETVILLHCDCFDGCEDLKSCCLDYRSICVFDVSTVESTDVEPNTVSDAISPVILVSIPSFQTELIQTEKILTTKTVSTTVTPSTLNKTTPVRVTLSTLSPKTTVKPTLMTTSKTTLKYVEPSKPKTVRPTTTTTKTTIVPTIVKTIPTTLKTNPATLKVIPTTLKTSSTTMKTISTTVKAISTTMKIPAKIKTIPPTTSSTTTASTTYVKLTTLEKIESTTKPVPKGEKLNNDKWHSTGDSPDTDPLPRNLLFVLGFAIFFVIAGSNCSKDIKNIRLIIRRNQSDEVRFLSADEQLDFTIQTENSVKIK